MRLLSVLLVLCLLVACAAQRVPPAAEPDPVPVQPPAPLPTLKPVPAETPEPTQAPTLPSNGTGYCQSQLCTNALVPPTAAVTAATAAASRQDCNDLKDNGICSKCLTELYGQIAKKCTIGAVRGAFDNPNCTSIPTFKAYFDCATDEFVAAKCPDIAPQAAGSSRTT
eukprot:18065-Heterococcus_DN1.PRE.1